MSSLTTVTHSEKFDACSFANVANLKSFDHVLLIGNDNEISTLCKKFCGSFKNIKKEKELNSLILKGEIFDKIIVSPDNIIETTFLQKVFQLANNDSLVVFCFGYEQAEVIANHIEENHHQANVWKLDSEFGPVVVTDAFGVSLQFN